MTADSWLAFVGTYTAADEDGVFGVRADEEGTLHRTSAANGGPNPTFLAPSPDGDYLYVANRPGNALHAAVLPDEGDGNVVAYAVDHETGSLSRLNEVSTEGEGTPCYCSVDATGQCVLTAQYNGGTVSVLPIDRDGRVGDPSVVEHVGTGPDEHRQSDPHPHCILPGPDNEYAYAPDLGADRVFDYDLDPGAATIEPADCGHVDVHAGAGPRHLDFHPNGRYAYLINELDSTLTAFERDAATGDLDAVTTVTTLPEGFEGESRPADVHVHPSGDYLYGSNRGHDSIAVYALEADGRPSLIEVESTRGEYPRNFAIDPAGEFLFAENADTDSIVTFRIAGDGSLDPTGDVVEIPTPTCLRFVGE